MSDNSILHNARTNKDDEFYTPYDFVKEELDHYEEQFNGKTIYCPCDDPDKSAFVKYFLDNFKRFNLRRLIATHYGSKEVHEWFCNAGHTVHEMYPNKRGLWLEDANGSFDDDYSVALMKESDIIVTNPPFSKFRCFFQQLLDMNKEFLIIGSNIAVSMNPIFKAWKEGKVWGGYNCENSCWFKRPDGTTKAINVTWYTNLIVDRVVEDCKTGTTIKDLVTKNKWQVYDKENDILVLKRVADYPDDYNGKVGVPTNAFYKFNLKYFDIIGDVRHSQPVNGIPTMARIIVKRKEKPEDESSA